MLGNEVILDIDEFPVLIDPLEGMTSISMVESPRLRCSVVTEEHKACVVGFGSVGKRVEQRIEVEEKVLRITTL